jgi:hypothetical protein
MKRINILYWVFTALLIPVFGIGSVIALTGSPAQVAVLTSLGYPAYLLLFLSITKILALIVIFVPGFSRLKEWAYAGLTFDVMGAIYSLLALDNSLGNIIIPIFALGFVIASYYLYHKRLKYEHQIGIQHLGGTIRYERE